MTPGRLLLMAGALTMASFAKAGAMILLGAPRTPAAARARECGLGMRGPMLGLAGVCLAIGLAPMFFWTMAARAVGSWRPTWAAMEAPVPLGTLGAVHAGLAVLGLAAAAWLWRKARVPGLRRGPTWDCGYATPCARMQYTSASVRRLQHGRLQFYILYVVAGLVALGVLVIWGGAR